jgi:hypothetical protein
MKCPVCRIDKIGEYFHVLSVDINQFKFNYCCSDCLAEHLRVPRHIKFVFTDEDREEIRKIVREEIRRGIVEAKPE